MRSAFMSRATSRLCSAVLAVLLSPLVAGAYQPPDRPRLAQTAAEIRVILAREVDFPGFDDPKTTLQQALALFTERYGLTFRVNEAAFRKEGLDDVLTTPIVEQTWPPGVPSNEVVIRTRPLRARTNAQV